MFYFSCFILSLVSFLMDVIICVLEWMFYYGVVSYDLAFISVFF